jgi:hypothetical protein
MTAVSKTNISAAECGKAATTDAWETCYHNVLCPSPNPPSLGCAWVKSCASKKPRLCFGMLCPSWLQ